ncbi:MAG: hypothetical protein JJU42_06290 [Rhodobacteraceae bacterium]|nr:hypothetical protein [Paracoccaceae bacterium]
MPLAMIALALGAGCASPSPEFAGAQETRIVHDGVPIAVFRQGTRAQAIRMENRWTDQRAMPARLVAAIESVTGCTARPGTVAGDSGVITTDLICP